MTTAQQWLDELTSYDTPSSRQFDKARSHRVAIGGTAPTGQGALVYPPKTPPER